MCGGDWWSGGDAGSTAKDGMNGTGDGSGIRSSRFVQINETSASTMKLRTAILLAKAPISLTSKQMVNS
jgi:hypothetical protein